MGVNGPTTADIYSAVTQRIIDALESGTIPWVRPWDAAPSTPHNASTRRPYSGVNTLLLWITETEHNYTTSGWLTYKQARALGGHVRKGEKGTTIVYWNVVKSSATTGKRASSKKPTGKTKPQQNDDEPKRARMYARYYTVFNVAQCEGLSLDNAAVDTFTPIERCESTVKATGAVITHGGASAAYNPHTDKIRMPSPNAFESPTHYYSTLFHELCHWSGAEHRLNRDLSGRFGTDAYAVEELVAELGSAYLCARNSVAGELRHADYLDAWIRVLRADSRAIFSVSSRAQAAADYVHPPESDAE